MSHNSRQRGPVERPDVAYHANRLAQVGGSVAARYLERNRMEVRSAILVDYITKVDAHNSSDESLAKALQWIRDQYPPNEFGVLVGTFARCHLGAPYIDHMLDLFGTICVHYRPVDDVPFPFRHARSLVGSDAYAFVEIYSDGAIVPIRTDGTPVAAQIGGSI